MNAIVDYGVGNLFSLESSFRAIGEAVTVTSDPEVLKTADRIILPGVGAFRDAAEKLNTTGLGPAVKELALSGKPLLGICLGMQLLFEKSYEYGEYEGLSLIPGKVKAIKDVTGDALKIPHIGWNALIFRKPSVLFRDIREGDHVYFVHSYYADECEAHTTAVTEYGAYLTASVEKDNIFGCQFHPEKSGSVGLRILKAFCEVK
ncbi:MAG: imidazole glycerol phosphate synthase subunit HisH [Lachnospiraceae bacterium]|nr:imidazole glycerol phosphate synthase subunit HisH [Lachnospiraceae bacterium]